MWFPVKKTEKIKILEFRKVKLKHSSLMVLLIILDFCGKSKVDCLENDLKPSKEHFNKFPFFGEKGEGVECGVKEENGEKKKGLGGSHVEYFRKSGSVFDEEENILLERHGNGDRSEGKKFEEIRMLDSVQKMKNNRIAEAPRGVQEQFIEMLGSSEYLQTLFHLVLT